DGLFYRGLLTYLPQVLREVPAVAALAVGPDLVGIEVGDYVFVGLLVVGIAGQYAGGHLSERIPVERGLALGFGALAVLAILFVPVSGAGFSVIATITALLGFFLFLVQPLYQVAVARYTPVASRGLAYGLTYLGEFGIGAGSIAVGGYLLGAYGVGALFGALAFVAGITALLAIVLGSGLASRWLGRAE
ncbi:MAG: MFS transporter, partial [Halodesulfurarchaeum sp.]